METTYVRLFGLSVAVWVLGAVCVLVLAGVRSLETYFVAGFVGLLIAMQVAAPTAERPAWWRTIRRVELACFLVFLYVISGRVLLIV